MKAYKFFGHYFNDNLAGESLSIVEVADKNFYMCQSLKGAIIFGKMFYEMYCTDSVLSWVSHEVAHQWWGNRLLFKKGTACYRFS